jgi:hypothetical protein
MIENVYCCSCTVPFILNQILMKLKYSRQLFEKYSDIKVHENLSSWSQVVLCGRRGQTYMMMPLVAILSFAKAPERSTKMLLYRVDSNWEKNETK